MAIHNNVLLKKIGNNDFAMIYNIENNAVLALMFGL